LQKELAQLLQRDSELDTIVKKLFEQNALGVISDERFISMSADYEDEQKRGAERIGQLQAQLKARDTEGSNTTKFLTLVRKYSDITELTANILNDLIESIVVYNAEGSGRKNSKQRVEINYKFVGVMQAQVQDMATSPQSDEKMAA